MKGQFSYGYLKEAVKAHLDLEEEELEAMNISQRFHIFANEAIQQICYKKPKYTYFQFRAVAAFTPLVYEDGELRLATDMEENYLAYNMPEPLFATEEEIEEWYNNQGIYRVGQVITMPSDFLAFAAKKAFAWTDTVARQEVNKSHFTHVSNAEIMVKYAATYQIPYQATWTVFARNTEEDSIVPMPSDLAVTIPIYVASVCLQQRNMNMAQAKRQEFEAAVARCKSTNLLENQSVTPTFR
jgi:hypothetical protein